MQHDPKRAADREPIRIRLMTSDRLTLALQSAPQDRALLAEYARRQAVCQRIAARTLGIAPQAEPTP